MIPLLLLALLAPIRAQTTDTNYRCDCSEFSYYWNPLYILRDTLSFFRPNWPPTRVELESIWNAPKYPDYFKIDIAFKGSAKDHLVHMDFFNLHGASTFNEDYYAQQIFTDTGEKLSLNENSFPWFKKEAGFRCENIPNGNSVDWTNPVPLIFETAPSIDACKQRRPIDAKISARIQSEVSSCTSQFWSDNELALIESADIFDFCQTPRIINLQTAPRGTPEEGRYLDSSVRIVYECRNGSRYTALIEHFVLDQQTADPCAKVRKDPAGIFASFKGVPNPNYCSNARTYLDRVLSLSGYKSLPARTCSCNQKTSSY